MLIKKRVLKETTIFTKGSRNFYINLKKIKIYTIGFYEDLIGYNLESPCSTKEKNEIVMLIEIWKK
jgi:hypothetical protein